MADTGKTEVEVTVGKEITPLQEAVIKSAARVVVVEIGGNPAEVERAIRQAVTDPQKVFVSDMQINITPRFTGFDFAEYTEPAAAIDQEYAPGAATGRYISEKFFKDRDEAREQLHKALSDLETSKNLHKEALNGIAGLEKSVQAIRSTQAGERERFKRRIADLEQLIDAAEAERNQYKQERDEVAGTTWYIRASELEQQIAGLKTNATVYEGVAKETQAQSAEVSRLLAVEKAHSLRLSRELLQARKQVEACRKLEDQSGRIKSLEADLSAHLRALQGMELDRDNYKRAFDKTSEVNTRLRNECDRLKKGLSKAGDKALALKERRNLTPVSDYARVILEDIQAVLFPED